MEGTHAVRRPSMEHAHAETMANKQKVGHDATVTSR
jgi:hypothetical protein